MDTQIIKIGKNHRSRVKLTHRQYLQTLMSWAFTKGSELPIGQHKIGDHEYEATISQLLRRRNPNTKPKKDILYCLLTERTLWWLCGVLKSIPLGQPGAGAPVGCF